jgi:hypothetical protein
LAARLVAVEDSLPALALEELYVHRVLAAFDPSSMIARSVKLCGLQPEAPSGIFATIASYDLVGGRFGVASDAGGKKDFKFQNVDVVLSSHSSSSSSSLAGGAPCLASSSEIPYV